jgi:hypothetical protein
VGGGNLVSAAAAFDAALVFGLDAMAGPLDGEG